MEAKEAQRIIESYEKAIAEGTEGGTVLRRASRLPAKKAKIKFAFFTYIEDLAHKGELDGETKERLATNYSMLNSFIDDATADKYVAIYKDWQEKKLSPSKQKKDERLIKQYLAYTYYLRDIDLYNEINDFMAEVSAK